MNTAPPQPRRGTGLGRGTANRIVDLLIAVVLIGDYLLLSFSHLLTGEKANWILLVGALQWVVIALAWPLGRLRGLRLSVPILGMLGLGMIMLFHAVTASVDGTGLAEYGATKVLTFFAIAGPALLIGMMLGRRSNLPGGKITPWLIIPLLGMCITAAATDQELMTIAYFEDLAVFAGVLVLPVHQALAFALGKITIFCHAASISASRSRDRLITFGVVGLCVVMAILSGSRGYLLAAGAGLMAQWALAQGHRRALILAAAIPVCGAWWFLPDVIRDGLDPTRVASSYSMMERSDLWTAAWAAFWERPVLGHGPGGFAAYFGWDQRVYPHNLPLEILSEFGLCGLVCFLAVLLPGLLRAMTIRTRGEHPNPMQMFAVGFLVFALVGSFGVADLIRNHFVFLAIGIATVACQARPESRRGSRSAPATPPAVRARQVQIIARPRPHIAANSR